MNLPPP